MEAIRQYNLSELAEYLESKIASLRKEEDEAAKYSAAREAEGQTPSFRLADIRLKISQYNFCLETIRLDQESWQ